MFKPVAKTVQMSCALKFKTQSYGFVQIFNLKYVE